mgnify:CR=1 FL=1
MRDVIILIIFALCVGIGGLIFRNSIDIYLLFVFLGAYLFEMVKGEK